MPTSAEEPTAETLPLSGVRVLLTRSPDRSGPWLEAFEEAGAQVIFLPLIDFEAVENPAQVSDRLWAASAGEFDWVVISSITTVRALKQYLGAQMLAGLAGKFRVATIGPTSTRFLEESGWQVDLAPEDQQSAVGLLELWDALPEDQACNQRILIPQADIAGTVLADGLSARGNAVTTVTAYHTVDYPARVQLRLHEPLAGSGPQSNGVNAVIWTPQQVRAADAAGGLDLVVAASPSAARAVARTLGNQINARFVAIGPTTDAEARQLGIPVAARATTPTAEGLVRAAISAVVP